MNRCQLVITGKDSTGNPLLIQRVEVWDVARAQSVVRQLAEHAFDVQRAEVLHGSMVLATFNGEHWDVAADRQMELPT